MDNPLNDYEHLRPQKPQNGRPRNGFIQKRGDHFDRFVTNHRPKTATPGVAGSLTDIMEMHLHVWRVSRVQNAHVWRGTAPPFTIRIHCPSLAGQSSNRAVRLMMSAAWAAIGACRCAPVGGGRAGAGGQRGGPMASI
jgi:hypothetical protein